MEIYCGNKSKDNQLSEEHTINHKGLQGCSLSPTMFNIYRSEITVKWNKVYTKCSTLSTCTKIHTVSFTDDQVIIGDSEHNLQRGVFTLQNKQKILEWKCHQINLR